MNQPICLDVETCSISAAQCQKPADTLGSQWYSKNRQIRTLRDNLDKLEAFLETHPFDNIEMILPASMVIILSESERDHCKEYFGSEGWTKSGGVYRKQVGEITVELRAERQEATEVVL